MAISRSDLKTTMYHEFLQSGDVVVGAYSDEGRQFKKGATPDSPQDIERKRKLIAASAARNGGELLLPIQAAMKAKTGKPIKAAKRAVKARSGNPEPLTPALTAEELRYESPRESIKQNTSESTARQTIYLSNNMGRIKMKVLDVLDSDMAFCLVFEDDDAMIFTPNPGETLKYIDPKGDTHQVYYANTIFNWTDGIKKLMILFKRDE